MKANEWGLQLKHFLGDSSLDESCIWEDVERSAVFHALSTLCIVDDDAAVDL